MGDQSYPQKWESKEESDEPCKGGEPGAKATVESDWEWLDAWQASYDAEPEHELDDFVIEAAKSCEFEHQRFWKIG